MLLTLSQTGKPEFGVRPPHEISSPLQQSRSYNSPLSRAIDSAPGYPSNHYTMSTSHRGLPPPSAMTLPEPSRSQQPPSQPPGHTPSSLQPQAHLGPMPAPPNQWSGGEDSMRHWLSTKAEEERTKQEEEKRRQEEERTRQESFKLEQRIVEQNILRESMKSGIPPQMIPIIFAGIGGSNLVSASVELLHQYAAQLKASQQQIQAMDIAVEPKVESRTTIPAPLTYAGQQPPVAQAPPSSSLQQAPFPPYASAPRIPPSGPTSAPRHAPGAELSRINTVELPPNNPPRPGQTEQQQSSPSIYFHHWVPPGVQDSKPNHAGTTSGPPSAQMQNTADDHRDSPRKRKATGDHKAVPPPPHISPSFSSQSSTRSRNNSNSQPHPHIHPHARSRSNKTPEEHSESTRRPHSRRDSVAANTRHGYDGNYTHEASSRPQSHLGHR